MAGDILKTATDGIEAIHLLVAERDQLRSDNDRLTSQLLMANQKADNLHHSLTTCVAERDHYMRFSVEVVTQLNTIQSIIGDAVKAATQAAYRPNNPVRPAKTEQLSEQENKTLERLGRVLGANNGEKQ